MKMKNCPNCDGACSAASIKGVMVEGETKWSCKHCRMKEYRFSKPQQQWCDWCCESFASTRAQRFCSNDCKWSWFLKCPYTIAAAEVSKREQVPPVVVAPS